MDVSVIVPVYQVELYIEECLRSVMRQAYDGEMECLVITDTESTDQKNHHQSSTFRRVDEEHPARPLRYKSRWDYTGMR